MSTVFILSDVAAAHTLHHSVLGAQTSDILQLLNVERDLSDLDVPS